MNVSVTKMPRYLSTILVIVLTSIGLWAQQNKPYETNNVISGTTFYKNYYSAGVSTITMAPQNASSYGLSTTVGNITFHYTPKANFNGKDYVLIEYFESFPGSPSFIGLEPIVVNSVVTTRIDYITTPKNQSVTIPVLDNDEATSFGLSLSSDIPYVLNGTATKSGNSLNFVPANNFTGVANINYLACDALNTCKMGTVVIKVLPDVAVVNDTLRYTIGKNTNANIFLGLNGYDGISANPGHGTISTVSSDVVKYTPSNNYTGSDYFSIYKVVGGVTYTKHIFTTIFNTTPSNKYAIDDYKATPKNTPVTFNLQANDIGSYVIIQPNTMTSPNGTIQYLGSGNVKFTPNANFTGTASFTYKIGFPGYNTVIETGRVQVEVSDQIPVSKTYNLSIPEEKPLVLKYFVPFTDWSFTKEANPKNGSLVIYPGQQTITLQGQTISGFNMAVYTPNAGFVNNTDEFSLKYCTGTGVCSIVKFEVYVKLDPNSANTNYCLDNCVWAGDTDGDGVVSVKDVLPIAMCMGVSGIERSNATTDWEAQFGNDWSNPYESSPVDLKHIDTDGDGLITSADTAAIQQSYGNIHQLPNTSLTKLGDKNIYFEPRDTFLTPGDDAIIDIHLGVLNKLMYDAHGFTFKFDYINHPLITPDKIHMLFSSDNWFVRDASALSMVKFPTNGSMHVAYGRTGSNPMTGFGTVGLVIVEDLEGIKSDDQGFMSFKFTEISYLDKNGEYVSIPDQIVTFKLGKKNTPVIANDDNVIVFPNPAMNYINVASTEGVSINAIRMFTPMGQLVKHVEGSTQLDLSSLPAGLYVLQIETNGGVVTKKFQKVN